MPQTSTPSTARAGSGWRIALLATVCLGVVLAINAATQPFVSITVGDSQVFYESASRAGSVMARAERLTAVAAVAVVIAAVGRASERRVSMSGWWWLDDDVALSVAMGGAVLAVLPATGTWAAASGIIAPADGVARHVGTAPDLLLLLGAAAIAVRYATTRGRASR